MAGKTNIRGEQIKDGSIDSVDIASGSIKVGELSEKVIADQTLITSTDTTNDRLLIWDATDSALKQVSIGNLGVTASPAGSDGQVQYNNGGATGGAASFYWDDSNNRVGIETASPTEKLDVAGNIKASGDLYVDKIRRASDSGTTTKILLDDEVVKIYAGHASDNICTINSTGLTVAGTTHLSSSAGTEVLRIAKADGDSREIVLENEGVDAASIYLNSAEHLFIRQENASNDLCLRIGSTNAIRIDGSASTVGIWTDTPITALDVHHNPTTLADNTGGGECVTFGTGTTAAGKLYYLNGTAWAEIDASAPATGADQMVGIALGTSSADGILIRGFFDVTTYLSSFSGGKAVYMSETAASMTTVAPTTAGAIVRIIGYCTDTANVIYFNPSSTWVELS